MVLSSLNVMVFERTHSWGRFALRVRAEDAEELFVASVVGFEA